MTWLHVWYIFVILSLLGIGLGLFYSFRTQIRQNEDPTKNWKSLAQYDREQEEKRSK